jgi:hypothetical protein
MIPWILFWYKDGHGEEVEEILYRMRGKVAPTQVVVPKKLKIPMFRIYAN